MTTASLPESDAELLLQQVKAAVGRAGHQRVETRGQPTGIHRMEAVDVLGRIDGGDDPGGVDLRR